MKEELLQYIWKQRLFNPKSLSTTDGEGVVVERPGVWNHGAGPDFQDARVRIGETLWAGSVEVHLRSSDWHAHGHKTDPNYDNVILHVVYDDEESAGLKDHRIPTLSLKGRIPRSVIAKYEHLRLAKERIACKAMLDQVNPSVAGLWKERLLMYRLERKNRDVELIFHRCGKDWLQTFFVLFAGYFGQNQNKLPFQQVALHLPVQRLLKLSDRPEKLEALAFGVAGLMDRLDPHERDRLGKEYRFLATKHDLRTISMPWKFGRIRPGATPKTRLRQLAACIGAMSELQHMAIHHDLHEWMEKGTKLLEEKDVRLSNALLEIIFINAVVPYAFFYAGQTGDKHLLDRALDALNGLEPENNRILRMWEQAGLNARTAAESQALIELYTQYCESKKCVLCNIGQSLIK